VISSGGPNVTLFIARSSSSFERHKQREREGGRGGGGGRDESRRNGDTERPDGPARDRDAKGED